LAGVALGDMDVHSAWRAWHLSILIGLGLLWWRAWDPLGAVATAAVCVAGVALCDIDRHVAGVALMALIGLGWIWWRAWAPLGAVVAAAVCMAGVALRNIDFRVAVVALGDMDVHSAWQAWHLSYGLALVAHLGPIGRRGRRRRLRGRQGTSRHRPSLCVARGRGGTYGTGLAPVACLGLICCTRRSFTISFLFPALPIPSLPFFCCLLEEVDMWGYPVLSLFIIQSTHMSLQNAFFVCYVTVEFDAGKLQIKSPQSHQALKIFFQRLKRYFVARKARDRRLEKSARSSRLHTNHMPIRMFRAKTTVQTA